MDVIGFSYQRRLVVEDVRQQAELAQARRRRLPR
jgi:hypothetical protein